MIYLNNDYIYGAHPQILKRIEEVNMQPEPGYGLDETCKNARRIILKACGLENEGKASVYFLVGGTQTNAVMIDALCPNGRGVIAAETGHINVHEAGAIEYSGHKVLAITSQDGKLKAAEIDKLMNGFFADATWPHCVRPGMVYISQPTELGTLYSFEELKALSETCHKWSLPLYADGARLVYALASKDNDVSLCDLARLCDAFYIGGTKAGLLFGEAVVCKDIDKLPDFFTLIKRHGALLAKGKILGAQFEALFSNNLYKELGANAISCAKYLKDGMKELGIETFVDSNTNQQFFSIPRNLAIKLSEIVAFDYWGAPGEDLCRIRLVTDWATKESDIDELLQYVKNFLGEK